MTTPAPDQRRLRRSWRTFALIAVAVILVCLVIGRSFLDTSDAQSGTISTQAAIPTLPVSSTSTSTAGSSTTTTATANSTTTTIYTHAISDPARIVIPSIKADALIVKVGLLDDGAMDVPPFGLAAWFRLGPAPGAAGPAVIVGHVDSKKGPDVFYHLKDLKPGDQFQVYDESGDTATFEVDSSELVLKSELPTQRIWNDTVEPVIRLITCGGKFDRSTGHYLSNTIVYGHLVE